MCVNSVSIPREIVFENVCDAICSLYSELVLVQILLLAGCIASTSIMRDHHQNVSHGKIGYFGVFYNICDLCVVCWHCWHNRDCKERRLFTTDNDTECTNGCTKTIQRIMMFFDVQAKEYTHDTFWCS